MVSTQKFLWCQTWQIIVELSDSSTLSLLKIVFEIVNNNQMRFLFLCSLFKVHAYHSCKSYKHNITAHLGKSHQINLSCISVVLIHGSTSQKLSEKIEYRLRPLWGLLTSRTNQQLPLKFNTIYRRTSKVSFQLIKVFETSSLTRLYYRAKIA